MGIQLPAGARLSHRSPAAGAILSSLIWTKRLFGVRGGKVRWRRPPTPTPTGRNSPAGPCAAEPDPAPDRRPFRTDCSDGHSRPDRSPEPEVCADPATSADACGPDARCGRLSTGSLECGREHTDGSSAQSPLRIHALAQPPRHARPSRRCGSVPHEAPGVQLGLRAAAPTGPWGRGARQVLPELRPPLAGRRRAPAPTGERGGFLR